MRGEVVSNDRTVRVHGGHAVVKIEFQHGIAIIHAVGIVRRHRVESSIASGCKDSAEWLTGRYIRGQPSTTTP